MFETKRVVHVTPYMEPSAGGPIVAVERLAAAASRNGYSSIIITTEEMAQQNGSSLRSKFQGAIIFSSQKSVFTRAAQKKIRDAVEAADILHLHTMWSPLVGMSARQAKKSNTPYVLSPHGMLDPYSMAQKAFKKKAYLRMFEYSTIENAASILFTAKEERRLAAPIIGGTPFRVVSLGADSPPIQREVLQNNFFKKYPNLKHRKCAIFLGRLHEKKRPLSAIRAIGRICKTEPDARLIIVGSGPAEAEMRTLCNDLGVERNVHFLGFLQGQRKWEALSAAQVFMLPSRQENFAIAMAEALHSGLPVLITRQVNTWQDVVNAGAGFVVDEGEIDESLANLCLELFNSDEKWQIASSAARDLASHAYSWAESCRRTYSLYDKVIKAHEVR